MLQPETLRIAKTVEDLDKLLSRIESGRLAKPDWIRLQGSCEIDEMNPEHRAAGENLEKMLSVLESEGVDVSGLRARVAALSAVGDG